MKGIIIIKEIVQHFWQELSQGIPKQSSDSNLLRAYKFQEKRLQKENLRLKVEAQPHGHFPDGREIRCWKDEHYQTTMIANTAKFNRTFYSIGQSKPLKSYSDIYLLYADITDCCDYSISGDDSYVCPNCGAVSTLNELQSDGCSYCSTRFTISELYPKVSGYYLVKDFGGTEKEVNADIFSYIKPFLIVLVPVGILLFIIQFDKTNTIYSIFNGLFLVFGCTLIAFVTGYLLWCGKTLGSLFFEGGKALTKLPALGSPKKFTEKMKQYSGEFSYEYFTDKVISILKTVIYCSNDERLPNYQGEETTQFDHIVESSFTGALALKSFEIENNIVTVQTVAYMENFYSNNGTIRRKEEKIPVTLQKDLSQEFNYHFNIQAVKCVHCGSSFDALSQRKCPYCDNALDLRQQDWVITKIG